MSYDGLDRLFDVSAAIYPGNHHLDYGYDPLDNIRSVAGTTTYAYDVQGNLASKNGINNPERYIDPDGREETDTGQMDLRAKPAIDAAHAKDRQIAEAMTGTHIPGISGGNVRVIQVNPSAVPSVSHQTIMKRRKLA